MNSIVAFEKHSMFFLLDGIYSIVDTRADDVDWAAVDRRRFVGSSSHRFNLSFAGLLKGRRLCISNLSFLLLLAS